MPFHDTKGPPPRVWGIEEMFASAETGLPAVPVQDIDLHGLRFRPEYVAAMCSAWLAAGRDLDAFNGLMALPLTTMNEFDQRQRAVAHAGPKWREALATITAANEENDHG